MSLSRNSHPSDLLQEEIAAYKAALTPPDPTWPPEVKLFMTELQQYLFEANTTIEGIQRQCGVYDHNFSTRFATWVGRTPKAYQIHHRIELAQRLLLHKDLKQVSVYQIALALGYDRAQSFSTIFKRRKGYRPSQYRSL